MNFIKKASAIDDILDRTLQISYDEQLGYLTTCPTNVGTGMRASVMLHLPGLSIMKRMNRIAQTINRFGFTIRGFMVKAHKFMAIFIKFQISWRWEKSEQEIIDALTELVDQIIHEELALRERLNEHNHTETLDRIYRSLGILKYSRLISVEEASHRLSDIKLGVDLGILDMEDFRFNELMVAIQSPFW